jgi:hypothetical protein
MTGFSEGKITMAPFGWLGKQLDPAAWFVVALGADCIFT